MNALRDAATPLRRVLDAYLAHRYAHLFYSLLVSMAVWPIVNSLGIGMRAIEAMLAINLLAAACTPEKPRTRNAVLAVLGLVLVARAAGEIFHNEPYATFSLVGWGLIGMFATASALSYALRARSVTSEHIYAVLGAYLLAGIFFGLFHAVLERAVPGSYAEGGTPLDGRFAIADAIYFSFVTIATLGYGDVLPLSDFARGLVVVEGVGGQLYIAVLVARLVSSSGIGA